MKIVITEMNCWEMEKWSYVIDSSIGAYKVQRLLYFVNLARDIYTKYRDKSMRVQAISNYFYSLYDDIQFDEKRGYYIGGKRKTKMHFNSNATYKDGFVFVKNISIQRLEQAIKKMQKGENILYKNFEYILMKR